MRSTPAEILELSQLTTEPYARGLRPRNITPIAGGSDTVTQVLGTEQVERSIFMKVSKGQIMLAVLNQHARLLNYAKNNTNTIDKSLKPLGGRGKPILFSPSKRQPLLVSSSQRQTTPVFPCHKQPLPILPSQRQLLSISSSQSYLHLSSPPRGSPCPSLLSGVPSSCLHVLEATVPCLPFPEATTPCFALQTATPDRFPVTKISPPPSPPHRGIIYPCLPHRGKPYLSPRPRSDSYLLSLPPRGKPSLFSFQRGNPYLFLPPRGNCFLSPPPRGNPSLSSLPWDEKIWMKYWNLSYDLTVKLFGSFSAIMIK